MTLQEYISFWQETYDKHQSRPTTYAAHNYVFKNHILPGLGDIPLSELTSEMVGEFLEERKRFGNHRTGSSGLGEETMRHIHRDLRCMGSGVKRNRVIHRRYLQIFANKKDPIGSCVTNQRSLWRCCFFCHASKS